MRRKHDRFYWDVLKEAWHIAWHHKHLWFFGFFATLLGFGSGADLFLRVYDVNSAVVPAALEGRLLAAFPGPATLKALVLASPFPALTLVLLAATLTVVVGVFVWLTTVSVTALVGATKKITQGGDVHVVDGLRAGHARFWTVFGLNLSAKAALVAVFALTSLSLYVLARDLSLVSGAFYVATYIVFTLLALAASIAAIFATNFAVLKNMAFGRALRNGLRLLAAHWLICLETVVALLVASLLVTAAAALLTLMTFVPIIVIFIFAAYFRAGASVSALSLLSAFILVAFGLILGALLTTFQTAAWTLLWSRLTEEKPVSFLARAKKKLVGLLRA